ncbi:MAG: TetR family transcriptional regulator [Candidatus Aminicenantes bacterium]|nr:TetR family transcriptional regulator [Candidatus Aminicenantes bacterium]
MKKDDLRNERKRHRIEENKEFILKAAEKVFTLKGYSLATMDQIAEEAQFSKVTLYRYFKSKSAIFLEIINKSFGDVHQKMTKILLEKRSAVEKLWELIHCMSSYYQQKKNLARILVLERSLMKKILNIDPRERLFPSSEHPRIPADFKAKMEDIYNIMCEIINEGIESGEFRKVDIKDACFVLGAMLRGFHFKGPVQDGDYKIKESTDLIHSFFLNGIKKGRKA